MTSSKFRIVQFGSGHHVQGTANLLFGSALHIFLFVAELGGERLPPMINGMNLKQVRAGAAVVRAEAWGDGPAGGISE